jgi:hypothetical protein
MADSQLQPQQNKPLNEAELQRLSVSTSQVGREEIMLAAMFGKMLQGDINGIKKQSAEVGGGLKVTDVDMSKVMPSHIIPALGVAPQQQQKPQQLAQQPVFQQVNQQPPNEPVAQWVPVQPTTTGSTPVQSFDPNQMEFDLNKQTRYEDIANAIDKLQNTVNILTDKVNILIEASNKKKPKTINGT